MNLRSIVTGSRNWPEGNDPQRWRVESILSSYVNIATAMGHTVTIVVGDCTTGVDAITYRYVMEYLSKQGVKLEVHVADWNRYGKSAGPKRNRAMVESGIAGCLAFPLGESRGTRGCAKMAIAEGIPTKIFEGTV